MSIILLFFIGTLLGKYCRYNYNNKKCSSVFIRQTPLEFEAFVADVFEKYYGGSAFVTVATGDYGVDFEHTVNGELYLGQVKCLCNDMSYKAIALVHSNIAKREAKGERFAGHPLSSFVRSEITKEIAKLTFIDKNQYVLIGSVGMGNWANVPWIAVLNKNITTSTQRGYYIMYMFSEDMQRLYLTLAAGVTETSKEELKGFKSKIRKVITMSEKVKKDDDIFLGTSAKARSFANLTAAYISYSVQEMPGEEELVEDLQEMIQYYEQYISRFNLNSPETQDSNPQGKDAQSDKITEKDLLGRDVLVKELSDFYTEYTDNNHSSFYLGIFARWGMGKSSIVQMLSNAIKERKSDKNEYLVCKVACSVFDKKDQLWVSILNQLIDEISKDKDKNKEDRFNYKLKFISFKTRFFARNFWEWLKGKNRWISILGIGSIFGFIIYKFMPLLMRESQSLREITFLITIVTACYTLVKSISSILKENVFLTDNRSIGNTYSRSVNEYKLLLKLLNGVPKKRILRYY
ncbi:hypothetical protein BCJMU51_2495 [Bacillus cereus]|nr:hypothetical protein BCM0057_2513 [Bacillus cereus]BCC23936.1 hypothetical protein BCM0079_2529 [Bacillus cereus]BCC35533.1 hypothetical protein BCM0105_2523 [Bacillus cereus]BCC41305.1 hypothetical protein BCJMU01_2472 [Bacillus cereus]BCC70805.1 hypothetical protein BCJMU51_2495 [Bacillus cereus]